MNSATEGTTQEILAASPAEDAAPAPIVVPEARKAPGGLHGVRLVGGDQEEREAWLWRARTRLWLSSLAGVLLIVGVGLGQTAAGAQVGHGLVWMSLAIGMVFGLKAAAESIAQRQVDIDVLMVVGAGLAAYIQHPGEGALLLFLFTLSGALEDLAMQRTQREISALHRLMPTEALALRAGAWVEAEPESLAVGERIKIRPGERVPTDASVCEGRSSLDQSTLTGESEPRKVTLGDAIYAGTVNIENTLEALVTRPASESSLQRVLGLVMEAREQREPMQRTIDRLSQPYALGVMGASALVMLVWWLALGETSSRAAYIAITFMIVLSPCALIIATPTATLAAIARGARQGVLFKGGQAIERLAHARAACLDKTGTLTFGRPSLVDVVAVGWSDPARLLGVAAGLEADSTHPIAAAVREGARARGVQPAPVRVLRHSAGQGIEGELEGDPVVVGTLDLVEETIPVCLRAQTRGVLASAQERGAMGAVVAAGGDHGAAAVLVISDALRPGAAQMIGELHALGVSPVRMLTGDNRATAQYIARQVGIDEFFADLMPEDKLRLVREMKSVPTGAGGAKGEGSGVVFIGDGVNDAPALAAADVSIAIGSIGSDAALESADIVLLHDDLRCVPWAIALARRARGVLRFNIAFALGVIGVMGAATLIGSRIDGWEVPMSVGVIAHEGGTLLVVANSLRLLVARGVKWAGPPAKA